MMAALVVALSMGSLTRRAVVLGGTPLVAAAMVPPAVAASPVREGMAAFVENDVERSIALFDKAIAERPESKPYLWQRGLSLYYVERFGEGAEQFAIDVSVNPNDTEEQIWHLLCVARLKGSLEAARADILRVGRDRRPVMRAAQELFAGTGTAGEAPLQQFATSSDAADAFYGSLYLGLYREANGDVAGARGYIKAAATSRYGRGSGDYMASLARVHVQRRGW